MYSNLLIIATLLLLSLSASAKCFDSGDCFEILSWTPACPGVGQEGTSTIAFRLDHTGGVYSKYCVEPLVDWGPSFERYDRKCEFPINTDNTIQVKYTYTESGTFTTKARLNVELPLFRPPHDEQFQSKTIEFTVGGGSCAAAPTAAPTLAPDSTGGGGDGTPTNAPISAANGQLLTIRTVILSQFLVLLAYVILV